MLCDCCMQLRCQGKSLSSVFLLRVIDTACQLPWSASLLSTFFEPKSTHILVFRCITVQTFNLTLPRFITGLADTQIDLTRDKPSWFPPGKSLQLPLPLLEIRHRIVHRHLPSLAELKRAAQNSLDWLWEWYWSQLDHAFGLNNDDVEVESIGSVREKLQGILKTYLKERKSEIKAKRRDERAAEMARSTYDLRFGIRSTSTPSSCTQAQLLQLLVDEKMILPADKKLGSSMSGAFLIWTPLLLAFSTASPSTLPISTVLDRLFENMNASVSRTMADIELDPAREGMSDWILHIVSSAEWQAAHSRAAPRLVEDTLARCFFEPTFWNLRIAEKLLVHEDVPNRKHWKAVLEAARSEDDMEVDHTDSDKMEVEVDDDNNDGMPVLKDTEFVKTGKEKIRGPRKVVGLWKPKPIGWLPDGFEDDD